MILSRIIRLLQKERPVKSLEKRNSNLSESGNQSASWRASSLALNPNTMLRLILLSSKIKKIFDYFQQQRGGGLWRIWRKHHVAQPLDHLESSDLDTRCIMLVSVRIFWKF